MRPSIVAALVWYEESPSWLAALVASLHGLVDHLVAVDGAYALVSTSMRQPTSGREQAETIQAAAAAVGIGCTIHVPQQAWAGNEVEKRSFAFRAANLVCEPGRDWILVVDADEVVTFWPRDIHDRLAASSCDVAAVSLWQRHISAPLPGENGVVFDEISGSDPFFRKLFRADPTLRVEGAHYVYVVGEPGEERYLWGHQGMHGVVEAEDIHDLRIEHRQEWRSPGRRKLQQTYYATREQVGTEVLVPC